MKWEKKHTTEEENCGIKTDSVWVTRQETWQTCRVFLQKGGSKCCEERRGIFWRKSEKCGEVEGRLELTAHALIKLHVRDSTTKDSEDSNFYNYQVSY